MRMDGDCMGDMEFVGHDVCVSEGGKNCVDWREFLYGGRFPESFSDFLLSLCLGCARAFVPSSQASPLRKNTAYFKVSW